MKNRIQKRRQKKPTTKVSQHQIRSIKIVPKINGISSTLLWDNSKTNNENYAALGIISSPNQQLNQTTTKRALAAMMTNIYPSKYTHACQVFDTEEVSNTLASMSSFFQESFKVPLGTECQGENQRQLMDLLPKKDMPAKGIKPEKKLSPFMQKYINKLVGLYGGSEKGLMSMQNDIENNYNQFTITRLRPLVELYKKQSQPE